MATRDLTTLADEAVPRRTRTGPIRRYIDGNMRGAYLTGPPQETTIYFCDRLWRGESYWIAAHPYADGTWYEGPKRKSEEQARKDLKGHLELLEWLDKRKKEE